MMARKMRARQTVIGVKKPVGGAAGKTREDRKRREKKAKIGETRIKTKTVAGDEGEPIAGR